MELVSYINIIKKAKANKYAIAAVNVFNLEVVQAVVDAANEDKAPFALAFAPSHIEYSGPDYVKGLINAAFKNSEVPMGVNLDHGRDIKDVALAIKLGFSSVMFDGSYLPLEENIKRTREVVELAHPFNVSVEGEVGRIIGEEEGGIVIEEPELTDPEVAKQYVEATDIDVLSVSVGSVHGMKYRHLVNVDVSLVEKIGKATSMPMALHGSFRTPDEVITKAVDAGVSKVNVALHYWEPLLRGVEDTIRGRKDIVDPALMLSKGRANVKDEIKRQFKILKSSNKAS